MLKNIKVNYKKLIIVTSVLFLALLSFFFIGQKTITLYQHLKTDLNDPNDEEEQTDNWEISTVFYDSTVNNGNTPLAEINWVEESNENVGLTPRTITVQINYKNTSVSNNYDVGKVSIEIPNILYHYKEMNLYISTNSTSSELSTLTVGANDANHTGYDWSFYKPNTSGYSTIDKLLFTNAVPIEKNSNVEGSIQVRYYIKPLKEGSMSLVPVEKYLDSCTHDLTENVKATLIAYSSTNEELYNVEGNDLTFHFYKEYTHPWTRADYNIEKTVSAIKGLDNLPNANNYYWVKYDFSVDDGLGYVSGYNSYPRIIANEVVIKDSFPDGTVVLNTNYTILNAVSDNNYEFKITSVNTNSPRYRYSIYVGYLKTNYQDTNTQITNNCDLYVKYIDSTEYVYKDSNSVSFMLNDYLLNTSHTNSVYKRMYSRERNVNTKTDYGITYTYYSNYHDTNVYYEAINGSDPNLINYIDSYIYFQIYYDGTPYDLKLYDDALFIDDINGNIRKLEDNEYYFEKISLPQYTMDINDVRLPKDTFDIDVYVRYRGDSSYTYHSTVGNYYGGSRQYINFDGDRKVAAVYIQYKNMTTSVLYRPYDDYYSFIPTVKMENVSNLQENEGKIYNAAYFEIYKDNILANNASISDYKEGFIYDILAPYDIQKYGTYKQRVAASIQYSNYSITEPRNFISAEKTMTNPPIQNAIGEKFEGESYINIYPGSTDFYYQYTDNDINLYLSNIPKEKRVKGYEFYDLLPLGMKLESTEEEIFNSFVDYVIQGNSKYYASTGLKIILYDGTVLTNDAITTLFKNAFSLEVVDNWNNTGRTKIHGKIDFGDDPIIVQATKLDYTYSKSGFSIKYKWSISYDSYIEFGKEWKNSIYYRFLDRNYSELISLTQSSGFHSPGKYFTYEIIDDTMYVGVQKEKVDLVLDLCGGDINDWVKTGIYYRPPNLSTQTASTSITSIISTNQDVQTSVQTDKSNYDTGKVESSKNSEYTYKLRVRTGTNDVTNLVVYDSLEKYAKDSEMNFVNASGTRNHWSGQFLDVDTTYAESKGYKVKVYYSEKDKPGSLSDDDGWHEYTDSTDKTKVKSLAFEYLDSNDNPAVLPANTLTYVLVKMKSPNEDLKTYTYNAAWTQWNAIDPITSQPVDFITGINSNIVRVGLPSSVEPEDINITLEKVWNDKDNNLNLRPESVMFKLIANGDYSTAQNVSITAANNWKNTVTVPKYDADGELITYTVDEDSIGLTNNYRYVPTIDGLKITNTISKDINLTKIWKDNTNAYTTRSTSVTFVVKQNGSVYKNVTVTGNYSTNTWTKTISVPVFDNSGNEYTYSIEEVSTTGYTTACFGFTCTNTLIGTENIQVTKEWVDKNNAYSTRPTSVSVKIKQNGTDYQTISLTGNSWTSNVITVPKYDSNGVKYNYTLEEETLDNYGLVNYDNANYKITNTLKKNINVTVTKKWIDDNNSNNTRPLSLTIHLLRNNANYKTLTLTGDTDTWTTSVEVPKYDNNQNEYTYSIREENDDIVGEYSNVTYSVDELKVTNKLQKSETIRIKKKWQDESNKYFTRPEEVDIKLYQNGTLYKEFKMNSNNENQDTWYYDLENVPKYDSNGKKYAYTLEEVTTLERYENITYDNTNYTITNELTKIPTVSIYFTVQNAYTEPGTDTLKYDDEGLRKALESHNIDPDSDYSFKFELKNLDNEQVYDGTLSTGGVLEFKDLPYGKYRAIETDDDHFSFVQMLSVMDIDGVDFVSDDYGGIITISPTGSNIVYGANVINKISMPIVNPSTSGMNISYFFVLFLISILGGLVSSVTIIKEKVVYH